MVTLVRPRKKPAPAHGRADADGPDSPIAYETDAYGWAIQQAGLLRAGRFELVDILNVADEIDAVAKTEQRATRSAIRLIVQHLLKWDYQPTRRSRSWALSLRAHRRGADRLLRDNPGLRSQLPILIGDAYADARDDALIETGLGEDAIPLVCPYSWDDIMDRPIIWSEGP